MGADIHSFVETRDTVGWHWRADLSFDNGPFNTATPWDPFDRYYPLFGHLAGVRDNDVPRLVPDRGDRLPADVSAEVYARIGPTLTEILDAAGEDRTAREMALQHRWSGLHSHGWATGAEIRSFDYDRTMRCPLVHKEEGLKGFWGYRCDRTDGLITVRQYLGEFWTARLFEIADLTLDPANVRVVFAFDN